MLVMLDFLIRHGHIMADKSRATGKLLRSYMLICACRVHDQSGGDK